MSLLGKITSRTFMNNIGVVAILGGVVTLAGITGLWLDRMNEENVVLAQTYRDASTAIALFDGHPGTSSTDWAIAYDSLGRRFDSYKDKPTDLG